ncbi:hypothetical protein Bca52824_067951 [Brassica carinata]|uniref:DNA topoisomerase 2 n=1 Tax=Brassica carinata TaxID=52824 RepID=A0A8X7UET5_BRACI|nr:hypothetical protein Bca52824_067951 [Brassica carinata]
MSQQSSPTDAIEQKNQVDHILLRPDEYIGSTKVTRENLWVYEEEGHLVYREVTNVAGLCKIFDEILINAIDQKDSNPNMKSIKVEVNADNNMISIYNDACIPVTTKKIGPQGLEFFLPELVFGTLRTSSNFNDEVKKTIGGRSGYCAKFTNIFFQTVHRRNCRCAELVQVFENNMKMRNDPKLEVYRNRKNWTKVSFIPDLEKFGLNHLHKDVVALMRKRVFDIAGCCKKGDSNVKFMLNGEEIRLKSFHDYVGRYLTPDKQMVHAKCESWKICVCLSERKFQQVSFVNCIATAKDGSHVEYLTRKITEHVVNYLNKTNEGANVQPTDVKETLWLFVNCFIENPSFAQTKESLTTDLGEPCILTEEQLEEVAKIVGKHSVLKAKIRQGKELSESPQEKGVHVEKLEDANEAGGKNSQRCTLILTQGEAAKALAIAGLCVVGRDFYGDFYDFLIPIYLGIFIERSPFFSTSPLSSPVLSRDPPFCVRRAISSSLYNRVGSVNDDSKSSSSTSKKH